MKESQKKDKYLYLTRELKKKMWNMKVTFIPIVIGALGTVTERVVKGLKDLGIIGRVEAIKTTALLRLARIQRRILVTREDLLPFKLPRKTISVT